MSDTLLQLCPRCFHSCQRITRLAFTEMFEVSTLNQSMGMNGSTWCSCGLRGIESDSLFTASCMTLSGSVLSILHHRSSADRTAGPEPVFMFYYQIMSAMWKKLQLHFILIVFALREHQCLRPQRPSLPDPSDGLMDWKSSVKGIKWRLAVMKNNKKYEKASDVNESLTGSQQLPV